MVGDETMLREWELGKSVGSPILNILETGEVTGNGYTPYDDEGTRARQNYLIKDGKLVGRLHSAMTAADLNEGLTGNARAVSFEYEPIVRMTTTYIDKGTLSFDELIGGVKLGIFIDQINHGSGMSTFTIAPNTSYMIRDGKLAEPVKISVISGNVMKTLNEIDGLSDEVTLLSFPTGGCGKMEQYPLPVGFGGPYVRVNGLNVQ
jgi:TldD protein